MNRQLLNGEVQAYISEHMQADVHTIAMAKSPFDGISAAELANQIAARKKSRRKLPTWFGTEGIYYPTLLSVEQCSSETTAAYKASLSIGGSLIDLTGGFGVDSYYFAGSNSSVIHCEINPGLSEIAAYNATLLGQKNTEFYSGDGLGLLQQHKKEFGTIYIDPARRSNVGKVFMLKDCTPDVVSNLDLLLGHAKRLLIKTAPLLDLTAGLKELKQVREIHIVSVKNECKELIWLLERGYEGETTIVCTTLNHEQKQLRFLMADEKTLSGGTAAAEEEPILPGAYLYEPDVALLKGGAFNLIAQHYTLQKLHAQTQLYVSDKIDSSFPGRIFRVEAVLTTATIKKEKNLLGSVVVRNYPDKAASLVEKYRIKPDEVKFLIFTRNMAQGKIILESTIIQHY